MKVPVVEKLTENPVPGQMERGSAVGLVVGAAIVDDCACTLIPETTIEKNISVEKITLLKPQNLLFVWTALELVFIKLNFCKKRWFFPIKILK